MRWTEEQLADHRARRAKWCAQVDQPAPAVAAATSAPPSRGPTAKAAGADPDRYGICGLCRAAGLLVPVREYRFHPLRAWRFDYAWPGLLLALEIEGGIWRQGGGAHTHPSNAMRDIEKMSEAAILGWRILRATPDETGNNVALDRVVRAMARESAR